jgi:hypothetical protein
MSETTEIQVDVKKEENGTIRWNHLHLIENGDVKNIFLVFDTEGDEVYIQYDSVQLLGSDGNSEEYELTHEEEEAVKAYIVDNYECEQKNTTED